VINSLWMVASAKFVSWMRSCFSRPNKVKILSIVNSLSWYNEKYWPELHLSSFTISLYVASSRLEIEEMIFSKSSFLRMNCSWKLLFRKLMVVKTQNRFWVALNSNGVLARHKEYVSCDHISLTFSSFCICVQEFAAGCFSVTETSWLKELLPS